MADRDARQIQSVRLHRCRHGTFHLNVGATTLHLSDWELALIGQTINKWICQHPEWLDKLDQSLAPDDSEGP